MKDLVSHFEPTNLDIDSLREILNDKFPDAEVSYSALTDSWKIVANMYTHVVQFNLKKQSKLKTKGKTSVKEVVARIIAVLLIFIPLFIMVRRNVINSDYVWIIIFLFSLCFDYLFNYIWGKLDPTYLSEIQREHFDALAKVSDLEEDRSDINLSALETE